MSESLLLEGAGLNIFQGEDIQLSSHTSDGATLLTLRRLTRLPSAPKNFFLKRHMTRYGLFTQILFQRSAKRCTRERFCRFHLRSSRRLFAGYFLRRGNFRKENPQKSRRRLKYIRLNRMRKRCLPSLCRSFLKSSCTTLSLRQTRRNIQRA